MTAADGWKWLDFACFFKYTIHLVYPKESPDTRLVFISDHEDRKPAWWRSEHMCKAHRHIKISWKMISCNELKCFFWHFYLHLFSGFIPSIGQRQKATILGFPWLMSPCQTEQRVWTQVVEWVLRGLKAPIQILNSHCTGNDNIHSSNSESHGLFHFIKWYFDVDPTVCFVYVRSHGALATHANGHRTCQDFK